jgi:hypothetical protein
MPDYPPKNQKPFPKSDIPGFPGYRTRDDRSGLDPVESYREEAFMEGFFIRKLFTLQVRTRNPLYLVLMFVFGVSLLFLALGLGLPSIPGLWATWWSTLAWPGMLKSICAYAFIIGLPFAFGAALLANLVINLIHLQPRPASHHKHSSNKR